LRGILQLLALSMLKNKFGNERNIPQTAVFALIIGDSRSATLAKFS
jgi:hypothetical protein